MREEFIAKNVSRKGVGIGDLPKLPGLKPGESIKVTNFYDKDELFQSADLLRLVETGVLSLTVVRDNVNHLVPPEMASRYLSYLDEDEMPNWATVDASKLVDPQPGDLVIHEKNGTVQLAYRTSAGTWKCITLSESLA